MCLAVALQAALNEERLGMLTAGSYPCESVLDARLFRLTVTQESP